MSQDDWQVLTGLTHGNTCDDRDSRVLVPVSTGKKLVTGQLLEICWSLAGTGIFKMKKKKKSALMFHEIQFMTFH